MHVGRANSFNHDGLIRNPEKPIRNDWLQVWKSVLFLNKYARSFSIPVYADLTLQHALNQNTVGFHYHSISIRSIRWTMVPTKTPRSVSDNFRLQAISDTVLTLQGARSALLWLSHESSDAAKHDLPVEQLLLYYSKHLHQRTRPNQHI